MIYLNQVIENSQINDVCNDEGDQNPKSLGKGHLYLTHIIHNKINTRR